MRIGQRLLDLDENVTDVAKTFLDVFLQAAAQDLSDLRMDVAGKTFPFRLGFQHRGENVRDHLAVKRLAA